MKPLKQSCLLALFSMATGCAMSTHVTESNYDSHKFYQEQFVSGPQSSMSRQCTRPELPEYNRLHCSQMIQKLEAARMAEPGHASINNSLLLIYNAMSMYDKARSLADGVIATDATDHEPYVIRAKIALQDGDDRLAQTVLNKAEYIVDDLAPIYETYAAVNYYRGEYRNAERALTKAFKLGSEQWRISYHQGVIAEAQEHWHEACAAYEDSLLSKSDYRPSMKRLRRLQISQGCY